MVVTDRSPILGAVLCGLAGLILTPVVVLIQAALLLPRNAFDEEGVFLAFHLAGYAAAVGAVYWAVVGWISANTRRPGRVFIPATVLFLAISTAAVLLYE